MIRCHQEGFRLYWRGKSQPRRIGRPTIPREHIEFIRRMSRDNPSWGEDNIFEELRGKLRVEHSTSTIRKYMVQGRPRRDCQVWRTFLENHGKEIFACDFTIQYTAFFSVVYVFVVMGIEKRRIVHTGVTANPMLTWVKQQIQEFCAFDRKPRFLLHDNDGIFGQFGHPKKDSRGRRYRCHLDHWLADVMQVQGVSTPYQSPNANSRVERFHRTLREDALNHFIFFSEDHVRRVVREFTRYYNGARPSQATHATPDPYPELLEPPPKNGTLVALPVLGGIQHDYRLVAWIAGPILIARPAAESPFSAYQPLGRAPLQAPPSLCGSGQGRRFPVGIRPTPDP